MKKLIVLAILLIPAMGWGEEKPGWYGQGPRPPALTREMIKAHMPKGLEGGVTFTVRWVRPELQFKRVSYSFSGYEWSDMKEELLINKYVNQALRENPGWSLVHFFPYARIGLGGYEFEIIIYLQREVGE